MTTDSAECRVDDLCGFRYPILLNPWFLAAAATILAIAAGLSTFLNDEAIWGYCGWLWSAHGDPPYVGAFENKPVGIFLIYRLSWSLFGSVDWPVAFLGRLAFAGTMLMLYQTGSRYQSRVGGAMAALILGLFSANRVADGEGSVHTETFMLFFTATAVSLISRIYLTHPPRQRWLNAFGSGLALGAALGFKQIAIMDVIGLIPLYFVAVRRNSSLRTILGDTFLLLLGGVAITAIGFLPLAASGISLHDYWRFVGGTLLLQRGTHDAGQHAMRFVRTWTDSPLVLYCPLVLSYLFQKRRLQECGVPFWSLLFWTVMAFLGANASADLWYHQFKQAILPISLVAGLGIDSFVRTLDRSAARALAWLYLSLVVMLFPYEGVIVEIAEHALTNGVPRPGKSVELTSRRLTAYIQSQTDPSDYIFIWHPQGTAQYYGQRRCSSRYFNTRFQFMPDFETRIAEDCAAHPPKLTFIDESQAAPALPSCLRALLTKSYTRSCRIDEFQVYWRNPPAK